MDLTTEMNMNSQNWEYNDSKFGSFKKRDVQEDYSSFRELLINFAAFYVPKHVYVSSTIRILGMIANVINVLVLTQKNMKSAVNTILTSLAVADFVLLMSYQEDILTYYPSTYQWTVIRIALMNSYNVSYAISMWLPVVVAVWRVMHVCYPTTTDRWRSVCRARLAIVSTYATCILVCTPYYLMRVVGHSKVDGDVVYFVAMPKIFFNNFRLFFNLETWFLNVTLRILPCFPLFVLTLMLIMTIYRANRNRSRLNLRIAPNKRRDRTTKMLIVLMVVFFLANFPRGMVYVFYKINIGDSFYVYHKTDKAMEALVLLNSSVNFILYCSMSTQFRETLAALYLKPWSMCKALCCTKHTASTERAVSV